MAAASFGVRTALNCRPRFEKAVARFSAWFRSVIGALNALGPAGIVEYHKMRPDGNPLNLPFFPRPRPYSQLRQSTLTMRKKFFRIEWGEHPISPRQRFKAMPR